MPTSSTLALGQATYELLDTLGGTPTTLNKGSVSRGIAISDNLRISQSVSSSATSTTVSSRRGSSFVTDLGIGEDYNAQNHAIVNDNLALQGNFKDLRVSLGAGKDTLNILGNVEGASILLDREGGPLDYNENLGSRESGAQANDFLNIQGSLTSAEDSFSTADPSRVRNNQIATGGGNDTVRIGGLIEDTDIHLGSGHDSLTLERDASSLFVGGAEGRDYIEFRGKSEDVVVNSGIHNDTVIFRGQISGTAFDVRSDSFQDTFHPVDGSSDSSNAPNTFKRTSAVELGAGSDSLVIGNGAIGAEFNTGSGFDTIRLSGAFSDTALHLDGVLEKDKFVWDWRNGSHVIEDLTVFDGADSISVASGSRFDQVDISSNNTGGDTLVVASNTSWYDSDLYFGSGSDRVVFGANTSYQSAFSFDDQPVPPSVISLGKGADLLVFGSGSQVNANVDLGSDFYRDTIRLSDDFDLEGLNITGAGDDDVLYIGSNEYYYASSADSAISTLGSDGWMRNWFSKA